MSQTFDPGVPGEEGAKFAAAAESISAARRYTTQKLADWGVGAEVAILASLIVSELAANAVRHAHSDFQVNLSRTDNSVRIGVSDRSSEVPIQKDPTLDSPSGYGLMIVNKVSEGWGWSLGENGKEIWANLKT